MAEGGSDKIVKKIVCGLCSGEYKQPKLLLCFHSFCLECLETYVGKNARDNVFDCPLCDTTIEVPEGGVKKFEWNIYLDSKLKSETNESHDCDLCGPETNAKNHCIDCEENYCERCSDIHLKQKATRMHTIVAISDPEDGDTKTIIKKKAFCTKHTKEEIKVVCKDCDKMLCVVCKLTDHEKHNSVDIDDEFLYSKRGLINTIQNADNSVSKLDKMLESHNAAKDKRNRNRDSALKEVQEYGDKLKEGIDMRIREIKALVNSQCDDACRKAESACADIKRIKTSLTNMSVHATQIVSLSDIVTLLTTAGKIQKQLHECIPKAETHKVVKEDEDFNDWEKHMALLSYSI